MTSPDYQPHKKAVRVVAAILVTAAVSGYFMGLHQTGSVMNLAPPDPAPSPEFEARAAAAPGVPVAVPYAEQNWRRDGVNAGWQSLLDHLVPADPSPAARPQVSEAERTRALLDRAERRAYDGAPPVVPHPIASHHSAACLACHGPGLQIKDRIASRMSHPFLTDCTQCHVPATGLEFQTAQPGLLHPLAGNLFAGTSPRPGARAWDGAPPTIPHPTFMRQDCSSCHGPTAAAPLRTTHPERLDCRQCHVPDARLDQGPFLSRMLLP